MQGPVAVTILYFPPAAMTGDIDNIVKPILDALRPGIYLDDQQVARVWVQKFEPERGFLSSPTSHFEALERPRPLVYIRVDNDVLTEEDREMVVNPEPRERAILDLLKERYEDEGYDFFVYPSPSLVQPSSRTIDRMRFCSRSRRGRGHRGQGRPQGWRGTSGS